MINIAVFCSGNGSNFQAIADSLKNGTIRAKIALMVCDSPGAFALERAKKMSIKSVLIERKDFKSKNEFENEIIKNLEEENIELICLAGFMRIISPTLLEKYPDKIINIHPALLPAFKGTHAIRDALEAKAKTTGVTVHFVDQEMDHGPIILQESLEIKDGDTEDSLAERIHQIEHQLYPEAIKFFVEGKLTLEGRKVSIG